MAKKQVYFIGIGGIGMSALARYFLAQKWAVSGSDIAETSITKELQKEGVKVKIGQEKSHLNPGIDLVIRTQAVNPKNPEFMAAKALNLRVMTYPEMVGILTQKSPTLAIAGAHGKSTTTAMTAKILVETGMDPMVILGSKYKLFGGKNFRAGSGHFVLEADEFGASFHHYSPTLAVINNIDREHLDFYKNFANVKKSFLKFISNIRPGGTLILNRDDKNLFSLESEISKIAKKHSLKNAWYSLSDAEAKKIKKILPVPGIHNLSNALAAFRLARALNIPETKILSSLKGYEGIWRRMEYKGKLKNTGTLIFDDYGHHPSEIQATLAAFKEKYPKDKLICIFQPHQAKRLKTLFKDFLVSFNNADSLILFPTYTVAGRDVEEKTYTAKHLAFEIAKNNPQKEIFYLDVPEELKKLVVKLAVGKKDSVAVLMGAGTISDYTDSLLS